LGETVPDLRFGPVARALHLVIDMQPLFSGDSPWSVAGLDAIVPGCAALIARDPACTAFARFIPPQRPEDAPGQWQGYYRVWSAVTRQHLPDDQLGILADLRDLAPRAPVFDKAGFSAFDNAGLAPFLGDRGIDTLILSGIETDVCVLSTALRAVDLGLRVILAEDAMTSADRGMHAAALAILRARFDLQVEIAPVATILEHWPAGGEEHRPAGGGGLMR
jgi:nicotinamidase-related amidase